MKPIQYVNAWIFLNEDEPAHSGYADPDSCFQTLISNNVYQSVDLLFLAFTDIVPASTPGAIAVNGGFTLQNGVVGHPKGLTNDDYMRMVVRDAKKNNPGIRFLTTLDYGAADQIAKIFQGCTQAAELATAAEAFANNAVAFLQAFGLHGFDLDWEYPLSGGTSQDQFNAFVTALRAAFKDDYLLTLSPASTQALGGDVVNASIDFLNLQLYASWVNKEEYLALGIDASRLAYGATFEAGDRQQTPQAVYQGVQDGGYTIVTQWRLNSSNFQEEQDGQVALYKLCKG